MEKKNYAIKYISELVANGVGIVLERLKENWFNIVKNPFI
jgi:hypothetical protein